MPRALTVQFKIRDSYGPLTSRRAVYSALETAGIRIENIKGTAEFRSFYGTLLSSAPSWVDVKMESKGVTVEIIAVWP